MFWEILLVIILVSINAFFVAAEFALVKLRLRDVKALVRKGSPSALRVVRIIDHLDAYLSACQLGITLASLGLGWIGEPLVAHTIEPWIRVLGMPADTVHYVALPLGFIIITLLHITAGEQVPKIFAIQKYMPTAQVIAFPLVFFYRVFQPLIWIVNSISNMMLRSLGIGIHSEHSEVHTLEELRAVLLESAAGGHLTHKERVIIENVLDLENKIARRYMLPRNQIVYLDKNKPMEEKLREASQSGHTRLPICHGDLDHILGILHVKDVFRAMANNETLTSLVTMARKPIFFLETVTLDVLLREFQKKRAVLAMIVDEYGVVSGMITLENILEELVGPIQDEFDNEIPLIIKKGTDRYEVDASCSVDEITRKLILELPATNSDTIGGVVIERSGHIPVVGEKLILGNHEITVLEADPTRIRRVLFQRLSSPNDVPEEGEPGELS